MGCSPQSAGHNIRWALRRLNVSENRMGPIRYTEVQTLPNAERQSGPRNLAALQQRFDSRQLALPPIQSLTIYVACIFAFAVAGQERAVKILAKLENAAFGFAIRGFRLDQQRDFLI